MSHNLEYLLTRPGFLKIVTIVLGIVAAILSAHSYGNSPYTDFYEEQVRLHNNSRNLPETVLELTNMTVTFSFLGISFLYLVVHALLYSICESRMNKFIDTAVHMTGALFLFGGGSLLLYAAVDIEENGCPTFHLVQQGPTPKKAVVTNVLQALSTNAIQGKSIWSPHLTDTRCHYFGEKIVAASLNILNSFLYGFLGFVIFTTEIEDL